MKNNNALLTPKPNQNGQVCILLALAIFWGAWLRFTPAIQSGFPINDGGMFFSAIQDLLANNFILPAATTYNRLNLPLAYPPLGFYLAAGLARLGIDPLQSILWFPPLATTASIFLVYRLARVITGDALQASLASLLYAIVPASTTWLLMGGGLTRALAFCFLILTLTGSYRLFLRDERSAFWETTLAGALTILSHPEMSLHAVALSLTFFLFRPSRHNLLQGLRVAAGVLALTAPWWGLVIANWGLSPFLSAPRTGFYSFFWAIYQLGSLKMVIEMPFSVVALAGLTGIALAITRKEWVLPITLLIPYLVNPRNANTVALIPLTVLAAQAILSVFIPALHTVQVGKKAQGLLATYLLLAGIIGAYISLDGFSQAHLTPELR